MNDNARLWLVVTAGIVLGFAGCGGGTGDGPDPEPPEEMFTTPIKCEGHEGFVGSVAVSPDGKLVASGSADQTLRFWDAADGKLIRTVKAFDPPVKGGWVGALAFSPDGKTLAASRWGGELRFYDPATGKPAPGRSPVREGGYDTAFSPDGKALAVAGREAVQVWGVAKGDKLHEFPTVRHGQAWCVRFSPDGKHLAAGLQGSGTPHVREGPMVRVWDLATGKEVFGARDAAHASASAIAFSPNGKLLAASGGKGAVDVYDWARNKQVTRFQAHSHSLFCLAFSPDGKTLYTGGNDPEVKSWEAITGKPLGSLKGHTDQVKDIALSKDGRVMATAGRDKLVLIWHRGAKGP